MMTPPEKPERVVCTAGVCLRTLFLLSLFAGSMTAASSDHLQARRWMQEVKQTTNPVKLLMLAWNIRESLERALAAEPENVEVRLDLLRFHTVTPRLAGGDPDAAREQMTEIARRDASLGHFARGYVAYRDK